MNRADRSAEKREELPVQVWMIQETEPPVQDNPLYDMPNVILTPHMGWKGLETRQRLVSILAANIQAFDEGRPQNVVS